MMSKEEIRDSTSQRAPHCIGLVDDIFILVPARATPGYSAVLRSL